VHYCKYHPLDGATYFCEQCNVHQCDHCVDDAQLPARCFVCGHHLVSLGSGNQAEPFWRRLPEAFKYPLNASSMSLIVITSIASVMAMLMPFLWILALALYLFAAGALLKYSFTCLERTAMGEMKAPDVMDAYQGGISLLLQLVVITIILGLAVGVAAHFLGPAIGGLLGFIAVISFPAILIRFAQTENMLEAMNPFAALSLIGAIGLPYGLLMAFILIMMTSVGLLHEWIGQLFPAVSYVLQSMVSSYYTLVAFHLMGYMLFQYQDQLGYSARIDEDEEQPKREAADRLAAQIQVLLKEGDYERVVTLYYQAFKQYPNDARFFDQFFELLYVCKKTALMADFGTSYLHFLNRKKRLDKLTPGFKQIRVIAPDFLPDSPALRLQLASLLKQQGDSALAVKLLNAMHKQYPDYAELPQAYYLLSDILGQMPAMQAQADKCRQMAQQLEKVAERKKLEAAMAQAEPAIPAAVKAPGRRPPPTVTKSGLQLELVPMEPVATNEKAE
jgi:tetratricopeptide (TPR) repeat protein